MTTFTPNFNLDLYEGADPANLTDQYNAAMGKVDTALHDGTGDVAELRNSVNTLNVNLSSVTNTVTEHTASIAANTQAVAEVKESVSNITGEVDTLSTSVDAMKTDVDTLSTSVDAMKTDVDNNKALVEEHVNYFANLGVTDEQSANDLHTQIDNAFQGVMSNTQAITNVNARISDNDVFSISNVLTPPWQEQYNRLYFAVNKSKTIIKFWGTYINTTGAAYNVPMVPIPGRISAGVQMYGMRLGIDTGLRFPVARPFGYVGWSWNGASITPVNTAGAGYTIGTDGYIYLFERSVSTMSLPHNAGGYFLQVPCYLADSGSWGEWPEPIE